MSSQSDGSPTRAVLVTGGTSGLGQAIALRLARRMAPVYLLARHATSKRDEMNAAFAAASLPNPVLLDADVSDRDRLVEIADEMTADGVNLGAVVASAGTNTRELALDVDPEDVRRMIDVNLYGAFATFQVFAPLVLQEAGGRFIAISSLNAVHGMRLRAPYSATKAGVSGLVRALAVEWGPMGATVNAIAPGVIQTPLNQAYMDQFPDRAPLMKEHTPVGRLGVVDDVAHAADYLASEGSGFMSGQTLVLDGGFSAGSSWW